MKLIEKFERFLDRAADQVGGYKILVVLALVVGYLLVLFFLKTFLLLFRDCQLATE